jgi:hypothetical protein
LTEIHIGTDIGGDIDDLCALALTWPSAELTAVTTVSDDGGRRARLLQTNARLPRKGGGLLAGAGRARAAGPHDAALDLLERSIARGAVVAAISREAEG